VKPNFHDGSLEICNLFCYQFIVNVNFTIVQIAGVQKDLQNAARTNNRARVTRLKENLAAMEAEKIQFTEKQEHHSKELEALQKRRDQIDKQLHAGGVAQLPTVEESSKLFPYVFITCLSCVVCTQLRDGNKNRISVLIILTLEAFTLMYHTFKNTIHSHYVHTSC